MGPLIPYGIINPEWYMLIILAIGIGFGMTLEQAGFSSSKKLVGTFFGYDFVVLKVFFTAAIVAMIGIIMMDFFGMLDISTIFIHSGYLKAIVTGGVIMGVGFILGGFCPGTSVAAASIGKIDAMFFIVGLFGGIIVYGELYESFQGLFTGRYFDREYIFDLVSLEKGTFVFWLIIVALVAFGFAAFLESGITDQRLKPNAIDYRGYGLEILLLITVAFIIAFMPTKRINTFAEVDEASVFNKTVNEKHFMSSDEVAYSILHKEYPVKIIDVRNEDDYRQFHVPGALNIPFSELQNTVWESTFANSDEKTVLISNGGVLAQKAFVWLTRKGYENIFVLDGGLNHFIDDIFHMPKPDEDVIRQQIHDQYRFRQRAAKVFRTGSDEIQTTKKGNTPRVEVQQPVTTSGGC